MVGKEEWKKKKEGDISVQEIKGEEKVTQE